MKQHQKQILSDLAHSTVHHLEEIGQSLQDALASAPDKIDQLRESVDPALDKLSGILKGSEKFVSGARDDAAEWRDSTRDKVSAAQSAFEEGEHDNNGAKLVWLLFGLGAGALLGLLLAPASGRRSRALLCDKLAKKHRHLEKFTSAKVTDLSNKAQGLSHKLQDRFQDAGEELTDTQLADNVRTALGKLADVGLPHLNIDSHEGEITLHGAPISAAQEKAMLAAVKAVEGVTNVVSNLQVKAEK